MVINSKNFFLIAVFVVLLDQLTKFLIISSKSNLPFEVASGIGITYTSNTGIAFGLFQGNNLLLIVLSSAVVALILRYRSKLENNFEKVAAALILAGTIGNLIDRITRGSVVDYIYVKGFPTFNLADTALTFGAMLIIFAYLKDKFKQQH